MKFKVMLVAVACNLAIILPTTIWAGEVSQELSGLEDEEISQRLRFIEQRLDEGRRHADYWQIGWTGFYTLSSMVQGAAAILTDNSDNRANYIVGATKSGLALTNMLLRPLTARHGADEIRAMPAETSEERLHRLELGEELLRKNAERAQERTMWKTHLISLGINFVGGAAILAFGDNKDALISTVSGIAVSELAIFSQPGRAINDLKEYKETFSEGHFQTSFSWQVIPIIGGIAVIINF